MQRPGVGKNEAYLRSKAPGWQQCSEQGKSDTVLGALENMVQRGISLCVQPETTGKSPRWGVCGTVGVF